MSMRSVSCKYSDISKHRELVSLPHLINFFFDWCSMQKDRPRVDNEGPPRGVVCIKTFVVAFVVKTGVGPFCGRDIGSYDVLYRNKEIHIYNLYCSTCLQ